MSVSPSASVSATAQSSAAPRTPTQAELLDFVRRTAADAELIASLPLDPEGRTWVRLEGPGGSEAWLIGGPPGTGTGWHDHADSVGAFLTAASLLVSGVGAYWAAMKGGNHRDKQTVFAGFGRF